MRGYDREALLELSLEDALEGGRRRLTLDGRDIDVNFPAGVRDGQLTFGKVEERRAARA